MLRRTTAVFTAALVLGAVAAPAALANDRDGSRKGGKKPIGSVASFDGTTLTVTLNDGSSATATADEDSRVKIDHRGRPAAKGNPTRGSLEDLVAGTLVLRLKTDDGVLEKVRIRRTAQTSPAPVAACEDGSDEAEGEESDTDSDGEVEEAEVEGEQDCDDADEADETDESDEAEDEDGADDDDDEDEEDEEEEEGVEETVEDATDELPLP